MKHFVEKERAEYEKLGVDSAEEKNFFGWYLINIIQKLIIIKLKSSKKYLAETLTFRTKMAT